MTLLISTLIITTALLGYGMWAIWSGRPRALRIPARIEEPRDRRDAERRYR